MNKILLKSFLVVGLAIVFSFLGSSNLYANTYTELFSDDIESGTAKWTITGESDGSTSSASLWHDSEKRSSSPTRAWYYGKESTGNYDTGYRNWGAITSELIAVPVDIQNPILQFSTYASTENDTSASYNDIGVVEISADGGNTWNRISTVKTTSGSWTTYYVPLPSYYLGPFIQIRYHFDSVNSFNNDYEGWYVDDIIVSGYLEEAEPANNPPVANPSGPYSVMEGQSLWLDGSLSYDPDSDQITGYLWNFGDEGANNFTFTNSPYINHTYARGGDYIVTLKVQDHELVSETVSTTVSVLEVNDAPVAAIGGPYMGDEDASVTFDASGSSDEESTQLTYIWNFGDGSTLSTSSATTSHVYSEPGTYAVSLTVNDGELNSSPSTASIVISNVNELPIANAGGPYTVIEGQEVTLDASGSTDPDGDTIQRYIWNFGDGDTIIDIISPTVKHIYTQGGTFTLTLKVSDGELVSEPVTTLVTVTEANAAPVAIAGSDQSVFTNEMLSFDASSSSDDAGIVTYSWNMGDGAVRSGKTVSHQYSTPGSYEVTLTATDAEGMQDSDTLLVTVANDDVTITSATYYSSQKQLIIEATSSSDSGAILNARGYGVMSPVSDGLYRIVVNTRYYDSTVIVDSSYGGTDSSTVTKAARR